MIKRRFGWSGCWAVVFLLALAGCSKDKSDQQDTDQDADTKQDANPDENRQSDEAGEGLPAETAIFGTVLTDAGAGLASVSVSAAGEQVLSSKDGTFRLALPAADDDVIVSLEKAGYLRGIKRLRVLDGTPTALEVVLMEEAPSQPLDADAGGTVEGLRGAALVAPPGVFVDARGKAVSGEVDVILTPLDPSVAAELDAYPGDLSARTDDNEPAQLETLGVLDVTVRQDGEVLNIDTGESVEIRIPAPAARTSDLPKKVGLWSFDEQDGLWIEEGTLSYNAAAHTYDGTIGHLSPWNADVPLEATCVHGRVVDESGATVPGAWVTLRGVDYQGGADANADADGEFCIAARKDSEVEITAIHPLGGGVTRAIQTGSTGTELPPLCGDCDDQGEWVIEAGVVTDAEGSETDCSDLQSPYLDTCAEGMTDMFVCFDPQGACTYDIGTGEISYENGSRFVSSGLTSKLYGSAGELCGSMETTVSVSGLPSVSYVNAEDDAWTILVNAQGDQTIECPNGETVTMTAKQAQTFSACAPAASGGSSDSGGESCEIVGGDSLGLPANCTKNSDCADGEVCCPDLGYCLPDIEGICGD